MRFSEEESGAYLGHLHDRIAALESENERLESKVAELDSLAEALNACNLKLESELELRDAITTLHVEQQLVDDDEMESENERLRKGIVWATDNAARAMTDTAGNYTLEWDGVGRFDAVGYDGTDSGLVAAVLRAMGEG